MPTTFETQFGSAIYGLWITWNNTPNAVLTSSTLKATLDFRLYGMHTLVQSGADTLSAATAFNFYVAFLNPDEATYEQVLYDSFGGSVGFLPTLGTPDVLTVQYDGTTHVI